MIVEAHKVRKSRAVDFFQRFCRTESTPVAMYVMQMRLAQQWVMVGRQRCGERWPNEQSAVGPTAV